MLNPCTLIFADPPLLNHTCVRVQQMLNFAYGDKYAAFLHDAVILYATALNDTMTKGLDYRSGVVVADQMRNKLFTGFLTLRTSGVVVLEFVFLCPFVSSMEFDTNAPTRHNTGCPTKMTPYAVLPKIVITNGTFSPKFYTHMYSTKIHMLTIFGV